MNPTGNHEVAGSIPGLCGLRISHCRELWCGLQTWLRSCVAAAVAVAPIRSLTWEPLYSAGVALKSKKIKKEKSKKKKKKKKKHTKKIKKKKALGKKNKKRTL